MSADRKEFSSALQNNLVINELWYSQKSLPKGALLSMYPILLVLGIYSQVIIIMNTLKVTNDRRYKYPLSISFVRQSMEVSDTSKS